MRELGKTAPAGALESERARTANDAAGTASALDYKRRADNEIERRLRRRARERAKLEKARRRARANEDWCLLLAGHRNLDYAPGGVRAGNPIGLRSKSYERLRAYERSIGLDTGEDGEQET